MDSKLTLKLDSAVIESAKKYAKNKNTSLSRLVENYLSWITSNKTGAEKISPLVKSLSGVISLSEDFDDKKGYGDFLESKYK
ncbi:MAG: hypothetical protein JKY52_07000 [Flavobacteriales bacterium]|nr:hypothetical protein [Flavobacteriales bacterium]